jgi:hypothetical protein
MKVRLIALGAIAAMFGLAAVGHAQIPIHFSGAAGMSPPIGDLGDASTVGFNLNMRGETGISRTWGWRGDISWDRFGGRGDTDNWTYLGFAGNVIHRQAGPLYEYGGLGVYNQRQALLRPFADIDETNLGVQTGVGYNFPRMGRTNTFVEIGLVNVFKPGSSAGNALTPSANSVWFPVRFGIRF